MDRYLSYIRFAFLGLWLHLIRKQRFYAVLAVLVFIILPAWILVVPGANFPRNALIEVQEEASVAETAAILENQSIIGHALVFRALARLTGADTEVKAGRYLFTAPEGVAVVLYRLVHGISGIDAIKVTVPEGMTVRQMSTVLEEALPGFDTQEFVEEAEPLEGYLFPDTYSFFADATPHEVIERMQGNFDERTENLRAEAEERGLDWNEIVIMASLVEKEANTPEDRRLVAGVLWNRNKEGMALQVDAVFGYIKGVDTYHPSGADLEIDSLYNTYLYPGFPPGPIGNPGLDAIEAALIPTSSENFYYLTGTDGRTYYSETFEEHKKNKERYLR